MALYQTTGSYGQPTSGSSNTFSIQSYKWPDGTWHNTPPPAASPAPAAAPAPSTPATSPVGGMTAQNLPNWASQAGSTAASLADPFAEQRPQYQNQLAKLMSDPGSLATSPLYKFAQEQGLEAINRTAGARGQLGSGNRLADLTRFGAGLAGENFFKMAPLLGRFAGADTSSPAAAGSAYAYGQGKAMDAFSNQEMERAYRDALAAGVRPPSTPQAPLAAPLSGGPAPLSQPGTYSSSYFPPQQSTVYPSASEYSLYGGPSGGAPSGPLDFGSDYGPGETPGMTSQNLLGGTGEGGAVDMGAGYGGDTMSTLGLDYNPSVGGFGVDTGMDWTGALPQISFPGSQTLAPIQGQLPPGYVPPEQNLYGTWDLIGSRG